METIIKLLVVFGPAMQGDAAKNIDHAISEANSFYEANGIEQQLELADQLFVDMTDEQNDSLVLTLMNKKGNLADPDLFTDPFLKTTFASIHDKRAHNADIVVFYGRRSNYVAGARATHALPHDAYIHLPDSAMDGITMLHEIGHLQGLTHSDGMCYPYKKDSPGFKTVMASGQMGNGGKKLAPGTPLFSNPDKTDPEFPFPVGIPNVFDSVTKLNATAPAVSTWRDQCTGAYTARPEPGEIADLSVGAKGETWMLDENGAPWRFEHVGWVHEPLPTGVKGADIDTGGPNLVWCIDTSGRLWSRSTGEWKQPLPGAWGSQISVASDGTCVHVGTNGQPWKRGANDASWRPFSNVYNLPKTVQIAVGSKDIFWRLDDQGRVTSFQAGSWAEPNPTLRAKSIAVSETNRPIVIDTQGHLLRSTDQGATWGSFSPGIPKPDDPKYDPLYPAATTKLISTGEGWKSLQVDGNGNLWKRINTAGDWLPVRWKYRLDVE